MLPGVVAGHYRREEAEFDVAALAARAYVEFVPARSCGARRGAASVARSPTATRSHYDIASLNVGSAIDRKRFRARRCTRWR